MDSIDDTIAVKGSVSQAVGAADACRTLTCPAAPGAQRARHGARRGRRAIAGRLGAIVLATTSSLWLAAGAAADTAGAWLFADRDIGESMTQAAAVIGSRDGQVGDGAAAIAAACDQGLGPVPRIVLLSRPLTGEETERCHRAADADLLAIVVGHQAVALVVPATAPVFAVAAPDLFAALGLHAAHAQAAPTAWNDVNPGYPKLPIGLLTPPAGSAAARLFDGRVLQPACGAAPVAGAPADPAARATYCGALRSDLAVVQRDGGVDAVAKWAASAPQGQLGVVTIDELRHLDTAVVPLPLDGALPTAANIDSGRYPAAEPLRLVIVMPHAIDPEHRDQAWRLAFDLVSETSIGPLGSLASAGLVPLAPEARADARAQVHAFLTQP